MTLYALYDNRKGKRNRKRGYYITYNPVTCQFTRCKRISDLKIWDVWDVDMIPFIEKESGLKSTYEIRLLGDHIIKKLSFKLLD